MPLPSPSIIDKPLSVPQLAARLGVSRTTVHKRVVSGEIPATKVGHSHIVPAKVVTKLIRRRHAAITRGVRRVVREYGGALERLSRE